MKTGTDRKYTAEFRDSAVRQVLEGGRGMAGSSALAGDVEQDAGQLGVLGAQRVGARQAPATGAGARSCRRR